MDVQRLSALFSRLRRPALPLLLAASLTACSTVGDWVDREEKETPRLAGDRLTVLSGQSSIAVDSTVAEVPFRKAQELQNRSWPQRGGNASNAIGAVAVTGLEEEDSASVGKGEEWETVLVTAPVVADGVVYAMDAVGFVSAHKADDLSEVLWLSDSPVRDEKEPILGGGLVVAAGHLFISTGQGYVFSLDSKNGALQWQRSIGAPVRSAPKLHQGILYVTTVDNQLIAMDAITGQTRWQHQGMGDRTGFLSAVSPAVGENIVVVTYSSGDMHGIAADTGRELWADSLAMADKTSATSVFTGFGGDAVIAGGVAFAASNNGLSSATHLLTGKRIWEQEIASASTPWLAGNYLFLLTPDAQVAAVYARDGRIKWAHRLEQYANPERKLDPYHWQGPIMLGEQLAVFGSHGVMVLLSPEDGKEIGRLDIPDGVMAMPAVAGGTVYLMTQDAELHALR